MMISKSWIWIILILIVIGIGIYVLVLGEKTAPEVSEGIEDNVSGVGGEAELLEEAVNESEADNVSEGSELEENIFENNNSV